MGRKFVIFDRDGVINVEKHFLYKIEDFEYERDVIEGLLKLKGLGYKFAIITNQSGIARGHYGEDDYKKLEKYIVEDLKRRGVEIEKTYYCPHHPEGLGDYRQECECRKPNTGNFVRAIRELDIDVSLSYMVGDRVTDLMPAEKLGLKTVLLTTGYGSEHLEKVKEKGLAAEVCDSILGFAESLENKGF